MLNYCECSCPDLTVVISDGGRETVAVGTYPNNRSPYGAVDMIGNVAEWARSIWGSDRNTLQFGYPYSNPNDGREAGLIDDPSGTRVYYVVRGGGWNAP